MTRTSLPKRGSLLSRSALSIALSLGIVAGGATVATPAFAAKQPAAPKLSLTKPFQQAAAPLSQAIETAKARADVVAARNGVQAANGAYQQARTSQARQQARTQVDAATAALGQTLTAEKGQLDAVFAAIGNQDDRYTAGQLAVALGSLAQDSAIQRRGLNAMIESGKAAPADLPRLQFFAGQLAWDMKDYAAARTSFQAAITAGYRENDVEAMLAESFIADNQVAQGLGVLKQAIDSRKAAGGTVPAAWYRRGLGAAFKAQLPDRAADFSMGLVRDYPTNDNWAGAITVLRETGKYPSQETLDLMRLMDRTKSYTEERDYIEYLQAVDARRLPGEAMKVIESGLAAGKLRAADPFITEAKGIAGQRVAADRASLAGLERDARAASASGATAAGAGDAFLSYADPVKAEALYNIALGKPGIDTGRVLTRLGIAQLDQGKFAEAQATFAKVEGPRKPIAQLWAIYAGQKAAPAAPAAPAAAAPTK